MSNKFFNCLFPSVLQKSFVAHDLKLIHQTVDILDKDVIASDQHFFLLLLLAGSVIRQLWLFRSLVLQSLTVLLVLQRTLLRLITLDLVRPRIRWIDNTSQRSSLIRMIVAYLKTTILLRCLLLNCILHPSGNALESHWFLSFLIWSWLNLSCCTLWKVLLRTLTLILIQLLILLISCWWQFHLVPELLVRSMVRAWEYCQFTIVLHNLVTEKDLLNHLVVWSWVLEEWIVHLTASSWVDSQKITPPIIFWDCLSNIVFVFQIGSFLHRF